MDAQALQLTVRADLHLSTTADNLFGGFCDLLEVPVVISYHVFGPSRAGVEQSWWVKLGEFLVIPNSVMLVKEDLPGQSTISDQEGWCVTGLALCDELDDIFVQWRDWEGMFDTCVTVEYHIQVHLEIATTFGVDEHLFFSRGLEYPLSLDASWLHIAFYTERAELFQSLHVVSCILKTPDDRFMCVLRSVQDESS